MKENKAPVFEWYLGAETGKSARSIKYSYRLNPIEDWSFFDDEVFAAYYFLWPADYTFQVKAHYMINNVSHESNVASFNVSVEKVIFQVKDEVGLKKAIPI